MATKLQLHVKRLMQSDRIWTIAHGVFTELLDNRPDIVRYLISNRTAADWVWLEEHLSGSIEAAERQGPVPWQRDQQDAAYQAAFCVVIGQFQLFYPQIVPPKWLWQTLRAVRGAHELGDWKEVVRDAFLSGQDEKAIELVNINMPTGPFVYWDTKFFNPRFFGQQPLGGLEPIQPPTEIWLTESRGTHVTFDDPLKAVGHAVAIYVMTKERPTMVSLVDVESLEPASPLFAIARTEVELRSILGESAHQLFVTAGLMNTENDPPE